MAVLDAFKKKFGRNSNYWLLFERLETKECSKVSQHRSFDRSATEQKVMGMKDSIPV